MIIVAPMPIVAITTTRGSGIDNLLTVDPKEVWADAASGGTVTIDIDLGSVLSIDTILLGGLHSAAAGASWAITGGIDAYDQAVLKAAGPLRVADVTGHFAAVSHGLWFGALSAVRYVRLAISQPAESPPLMAGVLLVGRAFQPGLGREWGSGRRVIDTGVATVLASGGFGIAEGVRKRSLSWTFGDLTADETDQLELIALDVGETRPLLVVEDAAATAGLRSRIHYCKFQQFRPFERRNPSQTRWELSVEEWV